jgi:hypothetical protein
MSFGAVKWGVLGVSSLLGAFSCSGTELNEVGDLSSSGNGGSSVGGVQSSGGTVGGRAGGESSGGRVAQGGVPGTVAGGGAAGIPPEIVAGAGGEAGQPAYGCPSCDLVVEGQDIRGADANDQKVYWTDYGTNDRLGNYQGNGRLLARSLDGGAISVVADSLAGPETVGVSAGYAYVAVNKRDEVDSPSGVIRVPLVGGAPQPLQGFSLGYIPYDGFYATPDYEYWNSNDHISRVAQTDGAQVEVFYPGPVGELFAVDDTQLYFFYRPTPENTAFGDTAGIWTLALTGGGVKTKLANYPGVYYVTRTQPLLDLQGDYIYGMEIDGDGGATYLTRMPKIGGAWKRVAEVYDGGTWQNVAVQGDHYLVDEQTASMRWIFSSTLPAPNTTLDWEDYSGSTTWNGWLVTRVGIFFANSAGLQLAVTTTP